MTSHQSLIFKKYIWIAIGVVIISGSFILFFFNKTTIMVHQVVIYGKVIKVEIAQTEAEREHGLSRHKPLLDNEGMFFIFDKPGFQGFWMKDMLFPLDIIWLSTDRKIVHIEKNLSPETYPEVFMPTEPAVYVLEVNSGLSDKNGWNEGDEVKFLQ